MSELEGETEDHDIDIRREIYWEDIAWLWGVNFYIHVDDFKRIHKKLVQMLCRYFPKDIDADYYLLWRFCADRTVSYGPLDCKLITKTCDICLIDLQHFLSKSKLSELFRFFDILFRAFKEGALGIKHNAGSAYVDWYTNDNSQYEKVVEFYLPTLLEKVKSD
jgi:hypothetical protein